MASTDIHDTDRIRLATTLGEAIRQIGDEHYASLVFNLKDALRLAEELHDTCYPQDCPFPLYDVDENGKPILD